MSDHEVPEAFLTATYHRTSGDQAVIEFDPDFKSLFNELDTLLPRAYAWCRRQSQSFRWEQPLDYVRPSIAATDPACHGKRIPGTRLGISTLGFLFRLNSHNDASKPVDPLNLRKDELEQLVGALRGLRLKKRP